MIPLLEKVIALLLRERDLWIARKQYQAPPLPAPVSPKTVPTVNETPRMQPAPSLPKPSPTNSPLIDFPSMILKWADAIKACEGADPSLNNPGNLKYSLLTASWGAQLGVRASDGGTFCYFPTYKQGHDALCKFLVLACRDELESYHHARTLGEFTMVYTGNPKPEFDYRPTISKMLGVPLDTQISTFL